MNLLVTGSTGFVGRYFFRTIKSYPYLASSLSFTKFLNGNYDKSVFSNVSVIVHCAARVHVMSDKSCDPLGAYREVNTTGTMKLAREAVEAGVKRFIFISSIKVNGESTILGSPFSSIDNRNPGDFYGQSKAEAEVQLLQLAKESGLEVVIIRPTLIYGPGVKANFSSLLKLVSKGLPLPFGNIKQNKRSLVSVKNLVDLIMICVDHPKAANQVFLVSDDHDVSTSSMVKYMSQALGKSNKLLPVPLWCYRLAGKVTGNPGVVNRLLGSLQVDITHTKETLGWVPPQTLKDGFKETAEAFILNKSK
ncbi:SDR family oxidoreductase [Shewanella vesiculosa]|uniref:UDP-glucose 4-epimerase family protein n=1 Tax=Shewanella vesiculosa TaxID=518738 RepID=UPI000F517396|nr:SDR family oxidoreductase [Shewanella vesiculosa]RPA46611.1 SDR family oxidoreductase [Shewanella vesiculosa]UJL42929.1 SDR family oxidoreductase [Shewanella vesiculosa]